MTQKAIFAGGCFWCLDAIFTQLTGVSTVTSGYTGGHIDKPNYNAICQGNTGHAEAVEIVFDPSMISYTDLLAVFFAMHDPTTLDRQGNDIGTQYRSAIFFLDITQKTAAEHFIHELTTTSAFADAIVTEVVAAGHFYPAEHNHQHYFHNNPQAPYCQKVIAPKLHKFLHIFNTKAKSSSM